MTYTVSSVTPMSSENQTNNTVVNACRTEDMNNIDTSTLGDNPPGDNSNIQQNNRQLPLETPPTEIPHADNPPHPDSGS